MSRTERYAWLSLLAWIAILFFLLVRFTTGIELLGHSFGFTIVEQSAGKLFGTYVSLTIAVIVFESIIASVTATVGRNGSVEKDERDHAIEARANLASYWFTAASLNIIVIQVLASAAYGITLLKDINLVTPTGVVLALLLVLVGAEIVKRIALIWNYRAA